MKRPLTNAVLAVLTALCAFSVIAGPSIARAGVLGPPVNSDIVVVIERPKNDAAGVTAIQGFAFSSIGIDRVEWTLDGEQMGRLPHGGSRGDVRDHPAYKKYPAAETGNSGFSAAWFMGLLTPGEHELVVTAYDTNGGVNSDQVTFTSNRFDKFLKQDEMKLQNFILQDVRTHDGSNHVYDVEFAWSQAGQTWEIRQIIEVCDATAGFLCPTLLAQAPVNVTATQQGQILSDYITVEWDPQSPLSDVAYEIQRREVFGQIVGVNTWVVAGFAPANADHFDDFGASTLSSRMYEYRVRALNGGGPSDWSATVTIPTPPSGPILPLNP